MSRSAADATRFTATGPYVNSKAPYQLPPNLKAAKPKQPSKPSQSPSSASAATSASSTAPTGETPRQKVERLRAQARAARLANSTTTFDRIVERGRRVANGAHKAMIYTLIAASGVCGAVTLYSVVSLTSWNRRQREIWLDKQLRELQAAREAYVKGTATTEQLEILRNEKIGEIEKRKREEAKEQRLWNRAKRFLFDGLKTEDAAAAAAAATTASISYNEAGHDDNKYNNNNGDKSLILEALHAKNAEAAAAATQQPGSLDVLAANAESTAKQSAKGWSSWIWGR